MNLFLLVINRKQSLGARSETAAKAKIPSD
jgi:hypothetical protein